MVAAEHDATVQSGRKDGVLGLMTDFDAMRDRILALERENNVLRSTKASVHGEGQMPNAATTPAQPSSSESCANSFGETLAEIDKIRKHYGADLFSTGTHDAIDDGIGVQQPNGTAKRSDFVSRDFAKPQHDCDDDDDDDEEDEDEEESLRRKALEEEEDRLIMQTASMMASDSIIVGSPGRFEAGDDNDPLGSSQNSGRRPVQSSLTSSNRSNSMNDSSVTSGAAMQRRGSSIRSGNRGNRRGSLVRCTAGGRRGNPNVSVSGTRRGSISQPKKSNVRLQRRHSARRINQTTSEAEQSSSSLLNLDEKERYSLSSKSRYNILDQESEHFRSSGSLADHMKQLMEDDDEYTTDDQSQEKAGIRALRLQKELSTKSLLGITSETAIDVFTRTVKLALGAKGKARGEAFKQFLLFSLQNDEEFVKRIGDECFLEVGKRHLDPFHFQDADVLDIFPQSDNTTEQAFDPAALSPFCFPRGVSVRLVPKVALERAGKLGWIGKTADRYQLLVFTDGSGVTSHGVAITMHHQICSETVTAALAVHRVRRKAAGVIIEWWRLWSFKKKMRKAPKDNGSGGRKGDGGGEQGAAGEKEAQNRRGSFSFFRRDSASSLKSFGSSIAPKSIAGKSVGEKKSKKSGKKKKQRKGGNGVTDILDEFLRTSPIPRYDSKTDTGIWRSAKLKVSKRTNECMVVVRHAPLKNKQGEEFEGLWQKLEEERTRLIEMLTGATIGGPSSNNVSVTNICFEESDGVSGKKRDTADGGDSSDIAKYYKPTVRLRARESYESMIKADEEGDICVMERCYVLMGGSPKEFALLLTALQQVVDSERQDFTPTSKPHLDIRRHLRGGDENAGSTSADGALKLRGVPTELLPNVGHVDLGNALGAAIAISDDTHAAVDKKGSLRSLLRANSKEEKNDEQSDEDKTGQRHNILKVMQAKAKLSREQEEIEFPESEMQHVYGKRDFFELKMPLPGATAIRLPMPLPQVATEWGLATLMLRIGAQSLMKILQSLLLERSVLITGVGTEEVSSCACTLIEALKPYEWASTFLPLLPASMLDFLNSPVPFVVGVAFERKEDLSAIESDERVKEARDDGMVLVNLTTCSVSVPLEPGEEELLAPPPDVSARLDLLQKRLEFVAGDSFTESRSLQAFIKDGVSVRESVTVHSVQKVIKYHMKSLAGDLAVDKKAWKRCGEQNEETNGFDFYPALFLNPMRARLQFLEEMAHTQMFVGYVDSRRKADLHAEKEQKGASGKRIASWVYDRWNEKKEREGAAS